MFYLLKFSHFQPTDSELELSKIDQNLQKNDRKLAKN